MRDEIRDILPAPSPEATLAAVAAMAEAETLQEIWTTLVEALAACGNERVNYGFTRYKVGRSIGDPSDVLFLSTHALEKVLWFHESGLYMRTPEYRWVRENTGACSWGHLKDERAAGRLTPDEAKAQDEIGASRARAGYTISFPETPPRSKGAMGLAFAHGVSQGTVDAWFAAHRDTVMALTGIAHARMGQMPLPVPGASLSARQREVLNWVADGKTTQDICVLTGLSASTIEKHLRAARTALSVETTAQAVAKLSFLNQLFATRDGDRAGG